MNPPEQVFAAYPQLDRPCAIPITRGLINETFLVAEGAAQDSAQARFILQRVNPIFAPGIHENIQAVTAHLADKGIETPRLIPTSDGRLFLDLEDAGRWRLMTRIAGESFDRVVSKEQARVAGALVARFHGALEDLDHEFQPLGIDLHDTPGHLANLQRALRECDPHPLHADVKLLAGHIATAFGAWEDLRDLPLRPAHGDLKFNNILFRGEEEPVALIDLDTLSPLPLHLELGDAWRSWCNRGGEDEADVHLDLEIFESSLAGYLGALPFSLSAEERRSLAFGIERLSLELAMRFAADALQESYFGWDAERFERAGAHNLQRARCQWRLYEQALATRAQRLALLSG